jgi:hypothetical protein
MNKKYYTELINDKPWQYISDHFDNLEKFTPTVITTLDVTPKDWIKFSVDYFDDAQQTSEYSKDHYSSFSNKLAKTMNDLGRNEYNSFELNYGVNGKTNKIMCEMLGKENIKKMNLLEDYIFIRLLVSWPGHGTAWHTDDAGSYIKIFSDLKINKDKKCQLGEVVRYWFSPTGWQNGHTFQISESVLWNYKAGEVFQIPFGMGHASANAGYTLKYSVSVTGIFND